MMKPPFKASDGAIYVIYASWFDKWTVWFVASLNMTFKIILVRYVMPTCAKSGSCYLSWSPGQAIIGFKTFLPAQIH